MNKRRIIAATLIGCGATAAVALAIPASASPTVSTAPSAVVHSAPGYGTQAQDPDLSNVGNAIEQLNEEANPTLAEADEALTSAEEAAAEGLIGAAAQNSTPDAAMSDAQFD